MHVPDGFLAPQVWAPLWAGAVPAWAWAVRAGRALRDERTLPLLAAVTAIAFVGSSIPVPLPGGTSVHLTLVGLLAVLFGVPAAFVALSLVFAVQALLLGQGGVTCLGLHALAIGLAGTSAAALAWRALRRVSSPAGLFAAGFAGVVVPALLVAVVLGVQPLVAHGADGQPLYFPFGLRTTLLAIVPVHALLGCVEGALTVAAGGVLARLGRPVAP
ncbi:MAG: hypothetical protein Kow0062_20350 [Acidobacteriota bacterium]